MIKLKIKFPWNYKINDNLLYLQIIWPAVYIWAQHTADKYRKKTCTSNWTANPVMHPQITCVIIPTSITFRGLWL